MASVYTRLTSHPPGIQHEPRRPFLHIGVKMGPHRGQVKAVIGDVRMGEGHLHGHGSLRRAEIEEGVEHVTRVADVFRLATHEKGTGLRCVG